MQKALPSRAAGHGPSAAICGLLNTNQRAIAQCVCVCGLGGVGWGHKGQCHQLEFKLYLGPARQDFPKASS